MELLVVQDHLDIRGLIVKDFEANLTSDNGGKYQFRDNVLWKDLRIGTTVVLRRPSSGTTGCVEDFDPADFKIDLLMGNATYLDALAPTGQNFNLTQTDMVLLKTGTASGTDNPVHALATNASGLGTGAFVYSTNPAQSTADYNGTNVLTSTSTGRNWGDGFGTPNITYIQSLRNAVTEADLVVLNGQSTGAGGGYNSITVQSGGTLTRQLDTTAVTTVRAHGRQARHQLLGAERRGQLRAASRRRAANLRPGRHCGHRGHGGHSTGGHPQLLS